MIIIGSPYDVIDLLDKSVEYIRSLYPEEYAHSFKLDELILKSSCFFIVSHDGNYVGCGAYVSCGDKMVELKHMYIDPAFRGFGYGLRLLSFIENTAKENRIEKIILETSQKQTDAMGLYKKMGYNVCDPYTEHHSEDIFMEKTL